MNRYTLDPQTLLFSLGMLGFLMAVVFLNFARAMPAYRAGLVAWTKAMTAAGAAFTLYFFRGQAPMLVTFVLANVLVIGLPYWGHEAHARLLNVAPRRKWALGLAAFGIGGVLPAGYVGLPFPPAFFTISLAFSALLGMTAWLLLQRLRERRSRAVLTAMVAYALLSVGFALRAVLGLLSSPEHFAPQAQSVAQIFTLVPGVVLIVVCSICILSMVHEHHMDQAQARQRDLEQSARQIEQASAMKSQFLANMSHEIRTPLNAILGSAQVLQRCTLDEEQRRIVGTIRTAGRTLLELVNDVLDLSRIESGRLDLERRPFLLREELAAIVEVLGPMALAKGLELTLRPLPADLPPLVGDAQRLQQVIYNLVGNAIKFTDTGGVAIEVSQLREDPDRVQLLLSVRDSGIGIAADQLRHIFDPFTQADSSTTRRYGGTGLGLAICRQLVTLMGGRIGVNSQPGAGSEFWVRLSFDAGTVPVEGPRARVPAAAGAGPRLDGVRVMVVDDVAANIEVAQLLLEAEGAVCITAQHGHEALERLRQASGGVDVVLMDLQMPDIDGFEVAQRMRTEPALARLPVIALSAGVLPHQRERALAVGMNGFIAKPFEAEGLVAAILEWAPPRRPAAREPVPATARAAKPPQEAFPVIAGIDGQKARQRFMGDGALFLRLLQGLRDEFADVIDLVRAEVDRGQPAAAAMRVHRLCGVAGIMLADTLAAAAAELEAALRSEEPVELDAKIQAVGDALGLLIGAMPARVEAAKVSAATGQDAAPVQPRPDHVAALLEAVREGDTGALDRFETLRSVLTQRYGVEAVARLDQALYGFRFEEAGSMLQAWGLRADEQTIGAPVA
ncbi:ATP-binding protein [Azohydromonas aeria]|uniref:ATP-binding protein n=1 Tax=Azohydromonas aeria TaxID=2590212 RepID=UPI0012F82A9B|nr:ATP-binding protein [Azohydromonas aeria]